MLASKAGNYGNIYLVGHDWGGYLAWMAAHSMPDGVLAGLVTINAPHPLLLFKKYALKPPDSAYFKYLLGDLSDWYFGVKDFAFYTKYMQNQTWWNQEWAQEYMLQWRKTGTSALSCFFRDNFKVSNGVLVPVEADEIKKIDPNMPILMLSGELDLFTSPMMYVNSIGLLTRKRGKILMHRSVQSMGNADILHNESSVDEVVSTFNSFARGIQRIRFSCWSVQHTPPHITGYEKQEIINDVSLQACIFGALMMTLLGVSTEFYIGPLLCKSKPLWLFSQLAMVPVVYGTLLSGSWGWMPFYAVAVFKFGFPELTTAVIVGWIGTTVDGTKVNKPARIMLFMDGVTTTPATTTNATSQQQPTHHSPKQTNKQTANN